MIEEEKEAIDKLKRSANYFVMPIYETTIILNLIEKQQKEIKESENYMKDKIRGKIKDLEDNMILFTNDKEKFNRYKYARNILEKLLEEE